MPLGPPLWPDRAPPNRAWLRGAPRKTLLGMADGAREGVVAGLAATAGGTAAFYTYTTYMQKFLKLSVGLTDTQTTAVSAASLVFALLLQ